MATYEKKSWESINLPPVSGDTTFRILDHISTDPENEVNGVIYDGRIISGFGIQNLNEIISQYCNPSTIDFSTNGLQPNDSSTATFYIYYTQDAWSTFTNDIVIIQYDWSYENYSKSILSDPISNILDYRQFFVYTLKTGTPDVQANVQVNLEQTLIDSFQIGGYTYYNYLLDLQSLTYPAEFTYAYSYDYFVDKVAPEPNTYNTLTIGVSKYLVTNTCYKYCIYYLNKYGGWDSLLFRGREIQTDNLERLSYKKNYVAQSMDFHKVDYLTTINEKWSLNTSFLDDTQSEKMINLMASNRMFIHNLETGKILPANITNSICEHKNCKNQGRKMATYNIEVEASQPKYRI